MENKQVHLEKISYDNIKAVLNLRLTKEQKQFVASNKTSIIQAYLELTDDDPMPVYTFAIYYGKKVVGFLMMCYDDDWTGYEREDWLNSDLYKEYEGKKYYCVWRFMIDKKYQKLGYGREAFKQALEFIKTSPDGKAEYAVISYEPSNTVARNLYRSFGFEEKFNDYLHDDDEIFAILKL